MDKNKEIIGLLSTKASLKQDVADLSERALSELKEIAQAKIDSYRSQIEDVRVRLKIEDKGVNEFELYVGSDVLIFQLHTNVFRFTDDHPFWKKKYLKDTPENGYFGVINIYNFLAESFERNRYNDEGYLIARVFINRENHCVIEGAENLHAVANDVAKTILTKARMQKIVEESILAAIYFDLLVPPYDMIERSSVVQIQAISSELQTGTGKRLGFKFANEDKDIV